MVSLSIPYQSQTPRVSKPHRAPFYEDASKEEFLAMTFVNGPEGVTFPNDKPAKLRFFLGYVDNVAVTGEDDADPVSVYSASIPSSVARLSPS